MLKENPTNPNTLSVPENLSNDIQVKYRHVFSSSDNFKEYFFATPDRTLKDARIRLGVFVKRLIEEPSERFLLMRGAAGRKRREEFPEMSIHSLEPTGSMSHAVALNGNRQFEIEEWKKEQPTEIEEFLKRIKEILMAKLELPAPKNDQTPEILYMYPKIKLSPEDMEETLQVVLPENSKVDFRQYSGSTDRHFDIETPGVNFSLHIWNHEVFEDYMTVSFRDDAVKVDHSIMEEYKKYYDETIIPTLLSNAISSLQPANVAISKNVEKIGSRNDESPAGIFENKFLTPNVFKDSRTGKLEGKRQHYAWGYGVDLDYEYSKRLGLIPEDIRWYDKDTRMHGWFTTTEQLWHSLFNSSYPGEIKILEENHADTSIVSRSQEMSPTHKLILDSIDTESNRAKTFEETAKKVIESYRFFTKMDLEMFTFPDGYQPIAVENEGNYAIGFKEVESGIELCFQANNEMITDQINSHQEANNAWIAKLQTDNEELQVLKTKYQK